mgnify:FL=1
MLGDGKTKATYLQMLIEPKGQQLEEKDEWKQEFLLEIKEDKRVLNLFEDDRYKIFGLPFYQENQKAKFKEELEKLLKIKV